MKMKIRIRICLLALTFALIIATYGFTQQNNPSFGRGGTGPGIGVADPGPRGGPAGAGGILPGVTDPGVIAFFKDGQTRFEEIEDVQKAVNTGLGPTFN